MQQILVKGGGEVSYKVLSKYHFTADQQYKSRLLYNKHIDDDFEFEVIVDAESLEHAEQIFEEHCRRIDGLCGILHIGHLAYITCNIIEWEGNFMLEEASQHKDLRRELGVIIKLLLLRESPKSITLEFIDNLRGREFDNYTKLQNPLVIEAALTSAIDSSFQYIKEHFLIPVELLNQFHSIQTPSASDLEKINSQLIEVTEKAFKSQLLYTVCITLRNYLNEHSSLAHATANLTNDQARVIYDTCKLHRLISLPHYMDIEKINYIRSVISNATHLDTLTITTNSS